MKRIILPAIIALMIGSVAVVSISAQSTSGKGWPENTRMKQIPVPPFDHGSTTIDNANYFNAMAIGITETNFRSYKQALKDAGFTAVDEDTEDNSTGFHFKARNSAGWLVEVTFYPRAPGGQGSLSVSR